MQNINIIQQKTKIVDVQPTLLIKEVVPDIHLHIKYVSQSFVTSINMPPVVIGYSSDFHWLHFISKVNFQGNLKVYPFSLTGYQNSGMVELWKVNDLLNPSNKTLLNETPKTAGEEYTILSGITLQMNETYVVGHTSAFFRDSGNLGGQGWWNTPILDILGSEYRRTTFNTLSYHASNTYAFRRIDFLNIDNNLLVDNPSALARDVAVAATFDEQAPSSIEDYTIILYEDLTNA